MKLNEILLTEVSFNSVPYKWIENNDNYVKASFEVGENQYTADGTYCPEDSESSSFWSLDFAQVVDDEETYNFTGSGNQYAVLGTSMQIFKDALADKADIETICVTAADKSRQQVYMRLMKKCLPNYTFTVDVMGIVGRMVRSAQKAPLQYDDAYYDKLSL